MERFSSDEVQNIDITYLSHMKYIATPWREFVRTIDNDEERLVISQFFEAGETLIQFMSCGYGLTCNNSELFSSPRGQ